MKNQPVALRNTFFIMAIYADRNNSTSLNGFKARPPDYGVINHYKREHPPGGEGWGRIAGVKPARSSIFGRLFRLVFFLLRILPDTKFNHPFDQIQRQRLVEGKLDCSFGRFIFGQFFLERRYSVGCGIEADVSLVGREIDEISVVIKGRHLIADFFDGSRRRHPDRSPQF